jgi:lipopolysaccharide/colanic/teichoic acid biosynthesis glycosyltransferase
VFRDSLGQTVGPRSHPQLKLETRQARVYLWVKRTADLAIVAILLLPVAVIVLFAALAILVTDGRPVFFMQDRVGLKGKIFQIWKLRTMRVHAGTRLHATLNNDQRITGLGSWLRASHIDELPQLWNILKGDMSLIGPRPEQTHLVRHYAMHISGYNMRHLVRPGLSGWSQVCFGYAADIEDTRKKLAYDLFYVENLGPLLDLKICVKTIQVYSNPAFVR